MRLVAPCRSVTLALALTALLAVPAGALDEPPTGLCALTLEEVESVTGLDFARIHELPTACSYTSDPAADLFALDLRIRSDPDLELVRLTYGRGGQDTTVAGLPAWSSDDGLFVDLGERLLVVQPVFFLSSATPDPVAIQAPLAELAAPRIRPALEAAFEATDRLTASFPVEVAGQPLHPDILAGEDFLRYVDLGTAGIVEVLAAQGMTLADITVGSAYIGESAELLAIQVPGLDAAILVPPVGARLAGVEATPEAQQRAGKALLAYPDRQVWLLVSGDVLWIVRQADETTLDAILAALP
jgi:hypothetical protein